MSGQSDNAEIAVLQNEMKQTNLALRDIKRDTNEIKTVLAALPANYYTKTEVDRMVKDISQTIKNRRVGIMIMQISTILMTAIITSLVIYFFEHR